MSYDIWLVDDDGRTVTESFNYTYNISPMLYSAWDGAGLRDLHGRRAGAVVPFLRHAIKVLHADVDGRYEAMNPPNGWGSREGCTDWLARILKVCLENPDAIFQEG
jgi:hypothetical protein